MKLLNFTLIKLTLCLIIGIGIAHVLEVSITHALYSTSVLALAFIISFIASKNKLHKTVWFGLVAFMTTISLGVLVYNLHDQGNFKNHYSNYVSTESGSNNNLTIRIKERLKPDYYNTKYIVDVLKVNDQSVSGKSHLNIQIDSAKLEYKIDDVFITTSSFNELPQPLNPDQFNYKNYLEKQYVYHQIFSEDTLLFKVPSQKHTLFGYADALRATINVKLKKYHFKDEELAIINALLLGQRQDISREIYNNYTNAGAIHILAVSGLHVGIILLLLNVAFKPIEYFKHGKAIKVVLLLTILWGFAIIAGLSASVTRAVAMFSIIAIGMNLKRPANIYNTLAISMFFLLLFKPMFLFDVGFQLSYLAVIAIVAIQPLIYKLWKPKLKIVDYFWQIFTVTLAAQFGVVPISLYYFHQFPGLFFISNIIIIPFLGLILGLGILIIILALLNILPQIFANIYGNIISGMNALVDWVSSQESFLFRDIPFTLFQVIASYMLILSFVNLYKFKTFKNLSLCLIAVLIFQGSFIYSSYTNADQEFIVFHKSRYSLIGQKTGTKFTMHHNLDSLMLSNDNVIKNYTVGNFINELRLDSIKSVYQINNKRLLIIDSSGIYNVKTFKPNYILLRNSPKINLERLIDSLQPQLIIADGSNYKSYVERWEATCNKQKLPFHQTSKKGAFIIK